MLLLQIIRVLLENEMSSVFLLFLEVFLIGEDICYTDHQAVERPASCEFYQFVLHGLLAHPKREEIWNV